MVRDPFRHLTQCEICKARCDTMADLVKHVAQAHGPAQAEDDGDEVFTPVPETCPVWGCWGTIRKRRCDKCGGCY